MNVYYDLHIHSCLSPCGDEEMTPNNIVNMCALKGLDVMAVTDHNHYGNVEVTYALAEEQGILCLPGLEVQTKEEVHVLCFFESLESLLAFGKDFESYRIKIVNNASFMGRQCFMNRDDEITGTFEYTLLTSMDLSMETLEKLVLKYDGVMVPAHVNRPSFSVYANLGFMPDNLGVKTVEAYKWLEIQERMVKGYKVIYNSDAHRLEFISEAVNAIEIEEKSVKAIIKYLRGV